MRRLISGALSVCVLILLNGCGRPTPPTRKDPEAIKERASDVIDSSGNVLYFHFDESQGATSFVDSSGTGNHATCTNCPLSGVLGKLNNASRFRASTSDVLTVTDNANLDNTAGLTIIAWVYPMLLGGNVETIVSKRVGTNNNQSYSLFFYTGDRLSVDLNGNGDRWQSTTVFATFNWYHIALRYDGSAANPRCTLYVNGARDVTANDAAATIPNNASNLYIGLLNSGDTRFLDALIDELAIYSRALRETEIQESYRRGVLRLGLDPYQDFRGVAYWTQRLFDQWS